MSPLAKAREAKKLTIGEAAKKLKITQATLRGLEDGCFLPRPCEVAAMRKLYGSHFTQAAQGELFGTQAKQGATE